MDQLVTPTPSASDQEELLLAVADGRYLVAAGDGVVRECGDELAARAGTSAEGAVGASLDRLLGGDGGGQDAGGSVLAAALAGRRQELTVAAPGGDAAMHLSVIPVPLTLGWEFTALLGDVGVRDPGTWTVDSLRVQHGQALAALEAVTGEEPGGRLAGILVVARPDAHERMGREEIARRRTARAAARAAALAAGAEGGADAPDALAGLVDSARELRRRLEETQASLQSTVAERDALHEQLEQEHERHGRAELEAGALREAHADLEVLRTDLDAARADLEAAHTERDGALAELRAELEEVYTERDEALAELAEARERADLLALEAGRVLTAATTIRTELALDHPSAGPGVVGDEPSPLPSAPGRSFALVGRDGCFTRLDDAFCALLGYGEADLRQAGWPSIIDNENMNAHRDIAAHLRCGALDEADVETFYMHACGLLVGIRAHVTRAGEEGDLLLEVDLEGIAAPAANRP